jgi:hypothetical protein
MSATRAGFVAFIRSARIVLPSRVIVTVDATALPDNSTDITNSFDYALARVAQIIETLNPIDYGRAVYNLAMHDLIFNSNAAIFDEVKLALNLAFQKTGFVQSTSDEGTSTSMALADYLTKQNAAMMELSKTQYGIQYIAIISLYSPLATFYAG